jgi:hypothetical protein
VASDDGSQSCTGSVSYEEGLLAVVGYIPIPGFTEFCKEQGSTFERVVYDSPCLVFA